MESLNLVFTLILIRTSERDTNSYLPLPAAVLGEHNATQRRNKWKLEAVFLTMKSVCEHTVADPRWSPLSQVQSSPVQEF